MTIRELYNTNISLQFKSQLIVSYAHIQNYDKVFRNLMLLTKEMSGYIAGCMEHKGVIGVDVTELGIGDFLTSIMDAQKADDYVLIADLIEIQLIPFLLNVQETMRNSCDIMFFQENWDENIAGLEERDNKLSALVKEEQRRWLQSEAYPYWLEPTNSGLYTMATMDEKGQYYLHSNVNPQLEARDFAKHYFDVTADSYTVLGLGLGYHIEELCKLDEGVTVHIYESSIEVILQAMLARDMRWLWTNPRITLIYDPDFKEMSKAIAKNLEMGMRDCFLIHYPSMRHIENKDIKDKLEKIFIRDSGIRNASVLMECNFRENITHKTDVVDVLKDKFKDKKAIIVAAGPSLDKNVELLRDKPENTLVIATGTVFRKLMAMGIDVDYVIVSDANRRVFKQVSGYLDSNIPMIYLSTAYRGFAKKYEGPKYIVFQKDYDRAEEEARKLGTQTYQTGGSVATTALDLCIALECKSIAFMGLDLAYTDNLAHAEGTSRRIANDIEDMQKVKGYQLEWSDDEQYSICKVELTTSNLFDMYRHWMEKRLKESDVTMTVYDASEGGSFVEGMEIISLKDYYKI
ncbi:MAG: motility associated factor glycosyltransferase family protein [Lachnospiraceae bacterium]|nr:motility associated factor glycosyltransferase family protein [Lachnospiraceae bacterium]